jgi:UDP-GlcNAc:undecaprenyl-phosphate GlcNAc-1-phosphate transferase
VWTQKSATFLGMAAPLMALSIPLVDVGLAITRRALKRQPIFSADRGHIHHRLLDRGLTPKRAVLILYGVCSIVAVLSLAANMVENDNRLSAFVIVLFCGVTWIGIQYLGYAEFSLAGRMILRGDFQRTLKARMDLNALEKQFAEAKTLEQCWELALEAAPRFGFHCVQMDVLGKRFECREGIFASEDSWVCRVSLGGAAFIEMARDRGATTQAAISGPFADMIQAELRKHIQRLREDRGEESLTISELARSESVS